MNDRIVFEDVSKFYGEVLGVNRVNLSLSAGITSLVGPNGSGKTTLMNLLTGLIRPSRGRVSVLGLDPVCNAAEFFRTVGYCSQFDSFPPNVSGFEFIRDGLRLHGLGRQQAEELSEEALARVSLTEGAHRKVAGYSKGMRQKARLAQSIAHHPSVLVLDEPLNGLDPMARSEALALFQALSRQGVHLIVSSHVLEELDRISDTVVLMASGYVVAEGSVHQVRQEVRDKPMQILVRCSHPELLASRMFCMNHVVEARLHRDGQGVFVRTRDIEQFYALLNRIASEGEIEVEAVAPADEDVNAIYQYLIGDGASQ